MNIEFKKYTVIPGFGLTLGFTLFYMSLVVIIPIGAAFVKTSALSWGEFWGIVTSPRVIASYKLTFGLSFLAALINLFFGFIAAWVLVRYNFPGSKILDALVDLPFALPTAVAGVTFASLYSGNGWIGRFLEPIGIRAAYTNLGILIVLTFIGLPFVIRTVQPVLSEFDKNIEDAAHSLGANRWQCFWKVIFPTIQPSLITGFALAFARGIGEYGSVIFIAGNIPMVSEITPLLIITKLEQYDYPAATAIAVSMLIISFVLLLTINLFQWWNNRKHHRMA